MTINFTKEHKERMEELALDMLLRNVSVTTRMGQVLNIHELLHTTTVSTLNNIRLDLAKKIENAENKDEWVSSSADSQYLDLMRKQKELVNLIIGWKRYTLEQQDLQIKKKALQEKLDNLKDSQKTPEDRIKELEAEIQKIDNNEISL